MFSSSSHLGQSSNVNCPPFAFPSGFGQYSKIGSSMSSTNNVFGTNKSSSSFGSTPELVGMPSPCFHPPGVLSSASSSNPPFFGGFPLLGENLAFGGFGLTAGPVSSACQQTQATNWSDALGPTNTTTTTAATIPAFGSSSSSMFRSTGTTFGVSSAPAFATVTEPSRTSLFGPSSSPAFATGLLTEPSRTSVFGPSSAPAFATGLLTESSRTSVFGPSTKSAFATGLLHEPKRTSWLGPSSSPAFATGLPEPSRTSMFGPSSAPAFSTGQAEPSRTFVFGPSSTPGFATGQTPFRTMSVPSAVSGLHGGTRITAYAPTAEIEDFKGEKMSIKLKSISAMPSYREKSHEELKWEDYQLRDKDRGHNPEMQSNLFSPPPTFPQPSMNTWFSTKPSNPFTPKTTILGPSGFETTSTPSFDSSPSVPSSTPNSLIFAPASWATSSCVGPKSIPRPGTNIFSTNLSVPQSLFIPASAPLTTTSFTTSSSFLNAQACPLVQSGPSFVQTNAVSRHNATSPSPGQSTFPSFLNSNIFTTPSTEVARSLVPRSPSLHPTCNQVNPGQPIPSIFNFVQPTQPGESSETISKTNSASSGLEGITGVSSQDISAQVSATRVTGVSQPSPVTNPFGILPAVPRMSVDRSGSTPSIQYGISSMPVSDKPTRVRISSLMTTRHLSQGRIKLPARKYNPKTDGQKVPFFSDEEIPRPPSADALFNPRDNPRALLVTAKSNAHKSSILKNTITLVNGIGNTDKCSKGQGETIFADLNFKHNGVYDDEFTSIKLTSRESSDTPVMHEWDTNVESLMPKLQDCEYYTEPSIQDLAAKERVEPGFCCRVKDFVVGHYSYGCIKFPGETDVRQLDLESIIQFKNHEVIVYMDESKKPPVGQGLNKLAEVTLLNVTCLDKKTGKQCMEEAKIDKYKALLIKKAKDQGTEFLSFDPAKGEWKFSVQHFS